MNPSPSTDSNLEKELFLSALEIEDATKRAEFLTEACGDDNALRMRLDTLLGKAEGTGEDLLDPSRYDNLERERESLANELSRDSEFLGQLGSTIKRLGDYDLIEEIGRGSMGVVFRARQVSLKREVAIKVILGSSLSSPEDRERFHIEAEAAATLSHPNIVPIYEIGRHLDHDYYSMALVEGGTLGDLLTGTPREPRQSATLIAKVAHAVQAAHQRGIIHRDLKPDNILLDQEGEPHISDFGLAYQLEQPTALTLSGQIMGTPQYMSPEQADNESLPVTTATDVYSLGAILYELLAGTPVFRGKSILQTLRMVRKDLPRPPRALNPAIDRDLETIVLKCLEKTPSNRYDSMKSLASDLEAWLHHRPIAARPPTSWERVKKWIRRRPVHAALVATACLFLLTLGIGGPLAAYHQSELRAKADQARREAEAERRKAQESAIRARETAIRNRNLAYDFSVRLTAAAAATTRNKFDLAPQSMLEVLRPVEGQQDLRGWEWYFLRGEIYQKDLSFKAGNGKVAILKFSPNGKMLVAATRESPDIQIRDGLHSSVIHRLAASGGNREALWSPDSLYLLTLSDAGLVTIWNAIRGERVAELPGEHNVRSISWTGAPHQLMSAHADGTLRTWNLADPAHILQVSEIETGITDLTQIAWSPNGRFLAGATGGSHALLWSADKLRDPPRELRGHDGPLTDLAWHRGGAWLATASKDKTLRVWQIPNGARVIRVAKHQGIMTDLTWDPHGFRLLYSERGQNLLKILLLDEDRLSAVAETENPIAVHDWSTRIHSLASGDENGTVKLTRFGLPATRKVLAKLDQPINTLRWNTDGTLVSCLTNQEEVVVNVIAEENIIEETPPDVTWLNPEPSPPLAHSLDPSTVKCSSWSSDRKRFVTGSVDGVIHMWDPETGEVVLSLQGHEAPVSALAWDRDNLRLVSADLSGELRLWDATAGVLLGEADPKDN